MLDSTKFNLVKRRPEKNEDSNINTNIIITKIFADISFERVAWFLASLVSPAVSLIDQDILVKLGNKYN